MGTLYNPSIVRDGLLLCLDAANVKSWKGAPTTNLFAGTNLLTWAGTSSRIADTTVLSETRNGGTIWHLEDASGVDPNINVDNYHMYNSYSPVSNGQKYTFSMDVKVLQKAIGANSAASNCFWVWYAGSTEYIYFADLPLNEWTRVKVTCTAGATYNYLIPRIDFDNSIIEIANIQFENTDFATPFVNGTRSNTEALLDISGNNESITATSLTYGSNNTFTFNGTDSLDTNIVRPSPVITPTTYELLFRYNDTVNYRGLIGASSYQSTGFGVGFASATSMRLLANGAAVGTEPTFSYIASEINHGVFIFNGRQLMSYRNGVLVYNNANIGFDIVSDGRAIKIANVLQGGWQSSASDIYSVKIYDRALSASEVTQNFNALRGRYGL